jgi:hypothetical protein
MMFHNKYKVSELGQQWMDDAMPPDQWYLHLPTPPQMCAEMLYVMPDDFEQRFKQLVVWIIYNSYWDQCVRMPKVASQEFQFIVDYTIGLGRELNLLVPVALTDPLGWPLSLEDCEWSSHWSHYPQFVIISFQEAGIKLNPTNPLDDERHPLYNEYSSLREHIAEQERLMKPRVRIERASDSELPPNLIMED